MTVVPNGNAASKPAPVEAVATPTTLPTRSHLVNVVSALTTAGLHVGIDRYRQTRK